MAGEGDFEILLTVAPGLEEVLRAEVREKGFGSQKVTAGGVLTRGNWLDVWRANLELRGAGRVLARLGAFRVAHLAQLDKRARKFPWPQVLRKDVPVRVEATCRQSRIYHAGAAAQRIATAITEELGAPIDENAEVCVKARIEDDLCTISVDTSGDLLHKRGYKQAVGKAPLRETMAALFLRQCEFDGNEPLLDPMCGSGSFTIEAAEIAAGLDPGRAREFAFTKLVTFDAEAWEDLRGGRRGMRPPFRFIGCDRDAGAIRISRANANRAGVADFTEFHCEPISGLVRPDGPPGLVIANPPYGARIGERKPLFGLYGALGQVLRERFSGWRVGLITSDASLAKATGLSFLPPGRTVLHGGLRVQLFRTDPLP